MITLKGKKDINKFKENYRLNVLNVHVSFNAKSNNLLQLVVANR